MTRYRVLSSVCYKCSACLVKRGSIQDDGFGVDNATRLKLVFEEAKKVKVCSACKTPRAHYKLECLKIRQTIKNGNEESFSYISASAVKDIFQNMRPEDCRFMGFDYPKVRPEYMILSVIPVCALIHFII